MNDNNEWLVSDGETITVTTDPCDDCESCGFAVCCACDNCIECNCGEWITLIDETF